MEKHAIKLKHPDNVSDLFYLECKGCNRLKDADIAIGHPGSSKEWCYWRSDWKCGSFRKKLGHEVFTHDVQNSTQNCLENENLTGIYQLEM